MGRRRGKVRQEGEEEGRLWWIWGWAGGNGRVGEEGRVWEGWAGVSGGYGVERHQYVLVRFVAVTLL